MALMIQFAYLQLLDLLTTLAFLVNGGQEANPLVRFMFETCRSPLFGLAAAKSAAILLALYCWKSGRNRLLLRVNIFFALLVTWNLVALLAL